jgi:hypothetical protein
MMKTSILTVVSFLLVLLTVNAGYYSDWFKSRPVSYWNDFVKERSDTLDTEGIRKSRYGVPYVISMKVKEVVEKRNTPHPVILFEPNGYYRDSLHIYPKVKAPEPAVFYYYTGLEGVWINSPDAGKANYLVRVTKKGVMLDAIQTPEKLKQILDFYKHYTPIL